MTNQQIVAVALLVALAYVLGRAHQSTTNAKILGEVQDEFDQASERIASLEAELHAREQGSLRKNAIRRQEERDLSA